jgi:plasmid maintenance system antidote protein VapI
MDFFRKNNLKKCNLVPTSQTWLNMQTAFDLWRLKKKRKELIAVLHPAAA